MNYTTVAATFTLAATPEVAASATPAIEGDDHDPCEAVLTQLSEVGIRRGFSVSLSAPGLRGTRGQAELEARCSAGHIEVAIREANGATASLSFGRGADNGFALEIVGEYPEVGTIYRTAILDDANAEPIPVSLNFAADMGAGLVFVEFDLAGEVLGAGGAAPGEEARRINAVFAPALATSPMWMDIHVMGFAAAGIWETMMSIHESELELMLGLAIPSPEPMAKVDADSKHAVQSCGVAFVLCLGSALFPAASPWACGGALTMCSLTLPCLPGDCSGDGV